MTSSAVARLLLLSVASMPLTSCMTAWLWSEDRGTPDVRTITVSCHVHDVTAAPRDEPPAIGVAFSVERGGEIPLHMLRYTARRPGYLELRPPPQLSWHELARAELFTPTTWDLRVTRGSYFRRSTANARVRFHGTVPRDALGELLSAEQVPPALRSRAVHLTPTSDCFWERPALDAFAKHPWMKLLSPRPPSSRHTQRPVAWVDRELKVIPPPENPVLRGVDDDGNTSERLAELRLLARLEDSYGRVRYALIPLSVLLQGAPLELERSGGLVRWSRTEIWRGTVENTRPPRNTRPYALPLRRDAFAYRYVRELDDGRGGIITTIGKVLVTPLTATLDFLVMTNPYLASLARALTAEAEAPKKPGSGTR